MKQHLKLDEWKVIEEGFHPEDNRSIESICSIGNGRMGQRGMFEEYYSGDSLQGSYIAGVYFPDKTKVGWWKNGYPEYFAKVINSVNWIGINVLINGTPLDLNTCSLRSFTRELNMKDGYLSRQFIAKMPNGEKIKVECKRFLSITDDECGAIEYAVTAMNFTGEFALVPYLDFDIINEDSNYEEKFWEEVNKSVDHKKASISAHTKKLDFHVGAAMRYEIYRDGEEISFQSLDSERKKYVANIVTIPVKEGEEISIHKYAGIVSSLNYLKEEVLQKAEAAVDRAHKKGFKAMLAEHTAAWHSKWEEIDIVIEGDLLAQQGIRFNIFHLHQTYTGADNRLNIGPKGFTGEKYGGSTYWDTEAYCIPFYLSTADQSVARNLLMYRYNHLQKAIENAVKLGFNNGAALYPMVTMNGEECHNEWEITFEEIHRNGAIAYAIYDYVNYTGDCKYIEEYGLEVLIAIARFWSQRFQFSEQKKQYVMLGVTGPNEYENNVNNNWYTSYIARWCMDYTILTIERLKKDNPERLNAILTATHFDVEKEISSWQFIIKNVYLPKDEKLGIYLQQEGFLDKDILPVSQLDPKHLPINQKWSWDRILRSCYIKQADVLQGIYFFEDQFAKEDIRRNFDFYEPITVHESSLSPCIHSILATHIGYKEKAYEMYIRTSRLDLDDINNEVCDGLHITSMAGTWMSIVKGFGGMRIKNNKMHLNPSLPDSWTSLKFRLKYKQGIIECCVRRCSIEINNLGNKELEIVIDKELIISAPGTSQKVSFGESVLT